MANKTDTETPRRSRRWIGPAAVREKLGGTSKTTLWRLRQDPKFPQPKRIGRLLLFDEEAIDAHIESLPDVAPAALEAAE